MNLPFGFDLKGLLAAFVALVVAVVSRSLVKYLSTKGSEALASAAANAEDARRSILERVEAYLFIGAANIAEKRLPALAEQVVDKRISTIDQVKAELYGWGRDLRNEVLSHFNQEGIDVLAVVGETALNQMIEAAANRVSPLPGMRTSAALLLLPVAEALVHKGIEYVRQYAFDLVSKAKTT